MTVYVDDFKLAGPSANLKIGWRLIAEGKDKLDIDKAIPLDLYLGCKHEREEITVNGRSVVKRTYNMEDYFKSIVEDYEDLSSQLLGRK